MTLKQNRITLKNIKHSAGLSRETHAFTATVYFDGKKVGTTMNDGGGGGDLFSPIDKAAEEKMYAYIASLPAVTTRGMSLQPDLDWVCSELVNAYLERREIKKRMKKYVMFTRTRGSSEIYEAPRLDLSLEEMARRLRTKYPDSVMLHELPEDKAVEMLQSYDAAS